MTFYLVKWQNLSIGPLLFDHDDNGYDSGGDSENDDNYWIMMMMMMMMMMMIMMMTTMMIIMIIKENNGIRNMLFDVAGFIALQKQKNSVALGRVVREV
jgi:hypothetical protein